MIEPRGLAIEVKTSSAAASIEHGVETFNVIGYAIDEGVGSLYSHPDLTIHVSRDLLSPIAFWANNGADVGYADQAGALIAALLKCIAEGILHDRHRIFCRGFVDSYGGIKMIGVGINEGHPLAMPDPREQNRSDD